MLQAADLFLRWPRVIGRVRWMGLGAQGAGFRVFNPAGQKFGGGLRRSDEGLQVGVEGAGKSLLINNGAGINLGVHLMERHAEGFVAGQKLLEERVDASIVGQEGRMEIEGFKRSFEEGGLEDLITVVADDVGHFPVFQSTNGSGVVEVPGVQEFDLVLAEELFEVEVVVRQRLLWAKRQGEDISEVVEAAPSEQGVEALPGLRRGSPQNKVGGKNDLWRVGKLRKNVMPKDEIRECLDSGKGDLHGRKIERVLRQRGKKGEGMLISSAYRTELGGFR